MRFRTAVRLLIVPALLTIASPALAQNPWQLGVMGGINISNINFDFEPLEVNESGDGRAGLLAGFFLAREINPRFGLEADVLFSQRGAEFGAGNFLFGGDQASVALSYIEIPVLARVNVASTTNATFRLLAGPSFAFRTNETVEVNGEELDAEQTDLSAFETGITLGGAAEFRSKWFVGARYTWGLTNIYNGEDADDLTLNNGGFSIFGGFRFK